MSLFVKMGFDILFIHKVFFRNFITFLIITIRIIKSGESIRPLSPENLKYLILRSLIGLGGIMLFFYSIGNLSLTDSSILNRLSPFFVIIAASVLLHEKLSVSNILLIITAFIGAVFIIKPEFNLSVLPALSGILSAVFAGITCTIVRFLKGKASPDKIIFYFSGISVLLLLVPALLMFKQYSFYNWMLLFLIGLFATGGQYYLTVGFQTYKAGAVSLVTYSEILFSFLLGLLFFSEYPDIYSIAGGVLIIISAAVFYLKK